MTITIFNDIKVEIPDEQFEYVEQYGNGYVPSAYEMLLKQEGITKHSDINLIKSEVQRLFSEEVRAAEVINDLWDGGTL